MNINEEKIDQAALALMYLTLHNHDCAWKQIDWEVTNRLHEKGYISNPKGKPQSVVFSEEGLAEAKLLFEQLFSD